MCNIEIFYKTISRLWFSYNTHSHVHVIICYKLCYNLQVNKVSVLLCTLTNHNSMGRQPSEKSDWFIYCAIPQTMLFHKLCYFTQVCISQKIAEILYEYVCKIDNHSTI